MSPDPALTPLIIIPSRLAASRFPNKPLVDLAGAPMIVQVWRRACEADIGPVVVAAGDREIVAAVEAAGGTAIMTTSDLPSGSDRIHEAAERIDPDDKYDVIVNVQGDLPTIEPRSIRAALDGLGNPEVDIATIASVIRRSEEYTSPSVVKAVIEMAEDQTVGRALYFTRATAPTGEGPLFHHIGLYAFRRAALRRFVGLPPSVLERRERLEQLRALAHGMRIDVALVDTVPLGVDTPADLDRAREIMAGHP